MRRLQILARQQAISSNVANGVALTVMLAGALNAQAADNQGNAAAANPPATTRQDSSQSSAQGSSPESAYNSLAEIVVTAQKRTESLQNVPISVTALRGEELDKNGIEGLSDYARLVPGLSYVDFGPGGERNNRSLVIRGVEAAGSEFAAPSVGYYLDEAPISAVDTRLFDLDRIEVLRGPQGTLYGIGTAGGTIKIITNQPKLDTFEALTEVTADGVSHGDTPGGRVNGMVNIPLVSDEAALRVSAYYRYEPGYIDSIVAPPGSPSYQIANSKLAAEKDFNDQRIRGARAQLLFKPNDRISITPTVWIENADVGGEPVHAPFQPGAGDLQIIREVKTSQALGFRFFALTGKFDLGFAELTAVTSYQKNRFQGVEDFTDLIRDLFPSEQQEAPFPIDDQRTHLTHEIRLASQGTGRTQWLVGLFDEKRFTDLFQGVTVPGINDLSGGQVPGDILAAYTDQLNIREYAAFGEFTYNFTPQLHATVGLRYFNVSQHDYSIFNGYLFNGSSTQLVESHDSGTRPKAQLSYNISSDVMVYTTAAQGFRLGGSVPEVANTAACREGLTELQLPYPTPTRYHADSVWNYEIGTKSSWFDKRLVIDADVYYIKRSDIVQSIPIPDNCGYSVTLNSGKASSRGVEFESSAQLTRYLNLDLSLGVTHAQLDTTDPSNPTASAGSRILQVPEFTVGLVTEYRRPIRGNLSGFVRADYQYVGNRANDYLVQDNPDHLLSGYGVAGLHLGVERNTWSTTLFVENIMDNRPRLSLWNFGHNYDTFYTLTPRTIGLTVRKSF